MKGVGRVRPWQLPNNLTDARMLKASWAHPANDQVAFEPVAVEIEFGLVVFRRSVNGPRAQR